MVDDTVQVPPVTGPGATVEAWEEYARLTGVEVEKGSTRDEIIEAVEAAQVTEPAPEPAPEPDVPVGGAEGVAGDTPAPATGDEEDDDADDVPDEETETPAAQEEAEEAPEGVTFVIEGQKAPDFARAAARPKKNAIVRAGGKSVQFIDGRFTTSNPSVINALDLLAEQHSDGRVVGFTRDTAEGPQKVRRWDAFAEVREADRPGYDGPPRNILGIRRLEAS